MSELRKGTMAVWGGESEPFPAGATTPPIFNSVTFAYDDLDDWYKVALGTHPGFIYSRNTNPTVKILEEKVRLLENGESATAFATGMAAISNTLFALLKPGDKVVSIKDTYGGTSKIFLEFLPRYGVQVRLCETTSTEDIESAIREGCDLLYLETPTNPTLKVVDLPRLASLARHYGAIVIVDNTFATPINQNPLILGAHLVVHSATKFLSGHSDVMGGILTGQEDLVKKVFEYREINGASLPAEAAYMILRGMKTLELRVSRQNASALTIARFLGTHPKVKQVYYPGLTSHPQHTTAKQQMRGFGGVLSFSIHGDYDQVKKFLPSLKLTHLAASLGSVSTIAGTPRTTSHVELTPEQRAALGIPESLIRYSVGIENVEDLIADLSQALDKI